MTRRDLAIASVLAVLACAVYVPSLDVGFYSDDYEWLGRMNPTVERPSYVFSVFFRDFNPVLHLSFVVDWLVGGEAGWVWHAQSILIHALCAMLVFALCRRREVDARLAGAAALCWAWNVRISEAVIWPAARGHALATLLCLAALATLNSSLRGRRVAALMLFLLGLLTKETALFPLLLLPLFLRDWRREWRLLALLGAIAIGFLAFNVVAKEDWHASAAAWWMLALKLPFILLRPLGLADVYRFDALGFAVVLAAFSAAAWWLRRTEALRGLVWVAVCTVPLIALDKLSSRYLYMMSVGYALVLCGAAGRLARIGPTRRPATVGLVILLVLVCVSNAVNIQREIADYRLLGAPYAACVESLRAPLRSLAAGKTAVVIDLGPRDAVPRLQRTIAERGNISKLIPYRKNAIGGLIELPDLLNLVRERSPGLLGSPDDPASAGPRRWFAFDGRDVRELTGPPAADLPPEIVFTAHWGDSVKYFGAAAAVSLAAQSD